MSGGRWLDALKKTLEKREADPREGGVAREGEERWDEDEAYELIREALTYLCQRHLEAGLPDYDPAPVGAAHDAIHEAYGADDIGTLRRAVHALVVARLKEFG